MALEQGSLGSDRSACVLRSLAGVVRSSFGPLPRDKLLVSSTRKVLLTSSGATVLGSLVCAHPVARWAMDAVSSHVASVGDGATAFLLLLCAAFEQAHLHIHRQPSQRCHLLRAIDWLQQARAALRAHGRK